MAVHGTLGRPRRGRLSANTLCAPWPKQEKSPAPISSAGELFYLVRDLSTGLTRAARHRPPSENDASGPAWTCRSLGNRTQWSGPHVYIILCKCFGAITTAQTIPAVLPNEHVL